MSKAKESVRNFRVADRLWDLTKKKAKDEGKTVSEVLRQALVEYVTK